MNMYYIYRYDTVTKLIATHMPLYSLVQPLCVGDVYSLTAYRTGLAMKASYDNLEKNQNLPIHNGLSTWKQRKVGYCHFVTALVKNAIEERITAIMKTKKQLFSLVLACLLLSG